MENTDSDSSNTSKRDRTPVSVPSRAPSADSRRTTRSTKTPRRDSAPRSSKSSTRSEARHALRTNVQVRHSPRPIKDRPNDAGARSQRQKTTGGPCVLRVKKLDKNFDEGDVCDMFKPYGHVVSVRLLYDRAGLSTGTADIVFSLRKSAIKVLLAIKKGNKFMGQQGLKATIHG